MRANKYIKKKNITLSYLNTLCEYLFIEKVKITTKISDDDVILLDETLQSKLFNEWYYHKIKYKTIEYNNALSLIENINKKNSILTKNLGVRIIGSLNFLIKEGNYYHYQESINKIINSDKTIIDKIYELKNIEPFKQTKKKITKKVKNVEDDFEDNDYEVIIDPYENFRWGGLSGEEAHTAYWNCH